MARVIGPPADAAVAGHPAGRRQPLPLLLGLSRGFAFADALRKSQPVMIPTSPLGRLSPGSRWLCRVRYALRVTRDIPRSVVTLAVSPLPLGRSCLCCCPFGLDQPEGAGAVERVGKPFGEGGQVL